MNEQLLDKIIRKLILSKDSKFYVTDVFKDEISLYEVINDEFKISKKQSLTSFLEDVKSNISPSYLKGFMEMFSIPKIEEKQRNGKEKLDFKYQTLNGKWYNITSFLNATNDTKLLFSLDYKCENNLSDSSQIVINDKYNSLISSLSDVLLKIYNVFDVEIKQLDDVKKIEEYINSILHQLIDKYPELKNNFRKSAQVASAMSYDSILIVDDDLVTRNMIKKVFNDEYKIIMATNGKEAIDYLELNNNKNKTESADNILGIFLDLTMPVMDGFAVLDYLSRNNYLSKIPVIIISGDYEKETKARVYNYNIADMLEKPFDFEVVRHRISNFINLYKSSNALGKLISNQSSDLKALIDPFVATYEYDYKENIERVNEYIKLLGKQFSNDYPEYGLTNESIEKMADASRYYDIGFYSIPRKILNKKDQLDDNELKKIKEYPLFGSKMIEYVLSLVSDMKYKDYASNIVKYYHENYDGTGYPLGLKEDKIPLEAQIASVAIAYNNLLRKVKDPKDIIINKTGKSFNPKIIDSFTKVCDDFLNVK